jgi:hypothetical protein
MAPPFLTSAVDAGEWSASRPGRFTPGARALGTHWRRDWVFPRADLDAMKKRKNLILAGNRTRAVQLSYPDSRINILTFVMEK